MTTTQRAFDVAAIGDQPGAIGADPVPTPADPDGTDEDAFVIRRLSQALAAIALEVQGDEPAPAGVRIDDLPDRVRLMRLELDLYRCHCRCGERQ